MRRSAGPPHASPGAASTAGALRPGATPRCGLGAALRCCVHGLSCRPALPAPWERTGAGQGAEGGAAGGAGPGGCGCVCRGGAPGTTWGKVGRHPTAAGTVISFLAEGQLELGAFGLCAAAGRLKVAWIHDHLLAQPLSSPCAPACCFCVCPFPPPRKSNTEDSESGPTGYLYSQKDPDTRRMSL